MDQWYLIIQRLLGVLIGIILFISAYKLLRTLENKEIDLSMVFLHKDLIVDLCGLLILAGSFVFLTGFVYVFFGNSIIVEILLDLNALILLIFTFSLQQLMKGDGKKWT